MNFSISTTSEKYQPKRHLDRFSRFCRAHGRYRQTDRPTDDGTRSVAIGRVELALRYHGMAVSQCERPMLKWLFDGLLA